jgi:hypothetical protein
MKGVCSQGRRVSTVCPCLQGSGVKVESVLRLDLA